jgi:NAD+ kinase
MQLNHEPPRHVAIVAPPNIRGATDEGRKLESSFKDSGLTAETWTSLSDETLVRRMSQGEFDLLMALGGDGTMLHAGRLCGQYGVPVLGVNLGRFGFLAEVKRGAWPQVLPDLAAGRFRVEERMMIHAEHRRGDQLLRHWEVLNEVVVCRGHFVRPVALQASIDGYVLAKYMADGLIAATPTGSTAYALAAGGPILPPEMRNILIVPVAPHLSVDRAVVLSEGACVTFKALANDEVVASADGQDAVSLEQGDEIYIVASNHTARFVRFQDPGYFYRNLTQFMEQNPAAGSAS